MPRFYNNAQRASYARKQEKLRQERERYDKDQQEASKWERAEGPLPEDVWEGTSVIASFGRDMSGITTNHIRTYTPNDLHIAESKGFYLQTAHFPGWRFYLVVRKEG